MKLPIVKIAELTGIHRDTISKRVADLPFEAGKEGAKLYSSEDALAAIYKTDSLEAARAHRSAVNVLLSFARLRLFSNVRELRLRLIRSLTLRASSMSLDSRRQLLDWSSGSALRSLFLANDRRPR